MSVPTIVIDTNVLIAALRSREGASFKLLSLLDEKHFTVGLTVPLLFEYEDVCSRELLGISSQAANDVLDFLCSVASKHAVYFMWRPHLHDAKDDMVLEAAVAASATHIVTFNTKDFKNIGLFGIQAMWPSTFLKHIGF